MARARRDSVLFTLVVTVVTVCGAIALAAMMLAGSGGRELAFYALLAAIPFGPITACFLWLDRYEPEPRSLLVAALAWGAFAATALGIVLSLAGAQWLYASETQTATLIAPVVEEATKGFFLLLLLWWRRDEIDGVLDGIVYAGMIGIGFAFVEDVLYFDAAARGDFGGPSGEDALTAVFVGRALLSPFAHPLFTMFIGIGVGIAVGSRTRGVRFFAPVVGYAVAVLVHGIWNASNDGMFGGFLFVYLTMMAPLLVLAIWFAVFRRSTERRMLHGALNDAARRGLLPASDIVWLVDLGNRRRGRRYTRQMGGPAGERRMRDYQQTAVELGFLHSRYLRGTPPPDFAERGREYVSRLRAIRPFIAFPGQVVPTR